MIDKIKQFILRSKAIFFILVLAGIGVSGVIIFFNISNLNYVDFITHYSITRTQQDFINIQREYVNLFSSTLKGLTANKEIVDLYLKGDRQKLYEYCLPLYRRFNQENGITHWYFIRPAPQKTCFLRMHAPHKYDDKITRTTLDNTVKTGKWTWGMEIGKTAFALRVVHPIYSGQRLIGYMELGLELERLLVLLKKQTGNEFGLLLRKQYVDRDKWASIRETKRLRNNWSDIKEMLLVTKTSSSLKDSLFLMNLGIINRVPREGLALERVQKGDNVFIRGIFPVKNGTVGNAGFVFVLKDFSHMYFGLEIQKSETILMIILFMSLITGFMIFFHTRAERELRKYRLQLEDIIDERTAKLKKINEELSREIELHKDAQKSLKKEWKARIEAERERINAVRLAGRASRLASIGVVTAGITHEINQPLNAIKVTADSISYWNRRNPGELPEPFVDQLSTISKSVDRVSEIIRHMRTFWIIPEESDIKKVVDLNRAIPQALTMIDQQLSSHGIQLTLALSKQPAHVRGHFVHLEQIVLNMVVNAMNSVDQCKSKDKMITIETALEGDSVTLTIADNGLGLPVDDAEKLFDPFFSTRKAGEGMGLGLAIVKYYVDRYKGTVTAHQAPNGGAVFLLTFPLADSPGSTPQSS